MSEWISVKDRLPEKDEVVIALIIGSDFIIQYQGETLEDAMEMARKHEWITLAFLGNDGWYEFDGFPEIVEPSYWMPLPEPPIEKMISAQPSADVVEVVRCKDCVNWEHGDCYRIELTLPDDFCSYGERREDGKADH